MKRSLGFDPRDYDYGAPTEAIRSILTEWIEIDWFEPNPATRDHAVRLFHEHQRLARAVAPELFPADIDIRVVCGGRGDFVSWCQRVRSQTSWDWKFSALKELSKQHATALGWSLEAHAQRVPMGIPRAGDLFVRFSDSNGSEHLVWNNVFPELHALDALPREGFRESADFYLGHAHGDAIECLTWQLAENTAELRGNPFLPLLLCYEAGAYPFSLDRDTVVLFSFDAQTSATG